MIEVIDKSRYSAFTESQLLAHLQAREADGLIVTGSETDVCILVFAAQLKRVAAPASTHRKRMRIAQ
jgi:nicotinamidase-related amidase